MAHRTLARPAEQSDLVKGSRFRAWVAPIDAQADAEAWVARVRASEPAAHHVAWAWRLGGLQRWSDDGEPGGTAGRPMLEVLLKRDLDRVVAVVARVFGGVRLGAGGLARAYGGAVARALDAAAVVEVPDRRSFALRAPFADADALLRLLADPAVDLGPPRFAADGLHLSGTALASAADDLAARAGEATRGRVRWSWVGDEAASAAGAAAALDDAQRK